MSLIDFWNTIHESGQLLVDPPGGASDQHADTALRDAIARLEAEWRLELAFEPPVLVVPVAVWAVEMMYRACQCLVYREIDPDMVAAALAVECPATESASADVCYSADLGLHVLPEILNLAKAAAPDDPLAHGLREIARRWPLSSVGVEPALPGKLDVSPFIEHPSLRRLYADRIIERGDASRVTNDHVKAEVRAALGAHARELTTSAVSTAAAAMGVERE